MARYNTVIASTSTSSTASLTTPSAGLFTELTGSSYTVTIGDPVLYNGQFQTFYNSASGAITLTFSSTGSGVFKGPGASGTTSQIMPSTSSMTLYSDGTNWITFFEGGGPLTASTATFSNAVQFNGSATASSAFTPTNTYDLVTLTYAQYNYGQPWSVQSTSFNATAGGRYFCASGITVTLSASPNLGDFVQLVDYNGTFNSSNLTVNPNGNKIMRNSANMTVSTNGAAFTLVWSGSTNGWLMGNGI
jgi:hypothetical protein